MSPSNVFTGEPNSPNGIGESNAFAFFREAACLRQKPVRFSYPDRENVGNAALLSSFGTTQPKTDAENPQVNR
jgi:hypothetical protein